MMDFEGFDRDLILSVVYLISLFKFTTVETVAAGL